MGAAAAKMAGFGEMKSDIDTLKTDINALSGVMSFLEKNGKGITDKFEVGKKLKDDVESKVSGITGQLDGIKSISSKIQNSISSVESLTGGGAGGMMGAVGGLGGMF